MSGRKAGFLLVLGSLILLALTAAAAQATVYTWNGGIGNWAVASNWTPITGPPNDTHKAIIPAGTVYIDSSSARGYSVSELTLGAGASLIISHYGLELWSDQTDHTCQATNNGSIQVINPGPDSSGFGSKQGSIVTLTGGGEVVLGGPYNLMGNGGWGGSFINDTDHTIRGGGYIQAGVTNLGQIIADDGTLYLQAPFVNTGAVIKAEGAGNAVELSSATITGGDLLPQDGKVTQGPGGVEFTNVNLGLGVYELYGPNGLTIHGDLTLEPGHQFTLFPGGSMRLTSNPDGTPPTFTNNTVIQMNGNHDYSCSFSYPDGTTLTGTGRIVMAGEFQNSFGGGGEALTQGPNHTIEGGGRLNTIINNGTIKANNGPLTIDYSSTNNGTIRADNGVLTISNLTNNGIFELGDSFTLNLAGGLLKVANYFQSFQSAFHCTSGTLSVTGNFSFAVQDATKMTWAVYPRTTLQMNGGGPWQSLEVGGKDLGVDPAGLDNNFALELKLEGTGTRVYLEDAIDNGHRSPGVREALYAMARYGQTPPIPGLTVPPGTTLNLNGIHLYVADSWSHNTVQVKAGEGDRYGGGQIIDIPMGPGTLLAPIRSLLLD